MVGYASQNLESSLKMCRILAGETPLTQDCENVGEEIDAIKHADSGYRQIKCVTPNARILSCGGGWISVENYINKHPDEMFVVSRAAGDMVGWNWDTPDIHVNIDEYHSLKRLLEMDNVIIINATTNTTMEGKWQMV